MQRVMPCPLCGAEVRAEAFEYTLGPHKGEWFGSVECSCGVSYATPDYHSTEQDAADAAVMAWNTRWLWTAGGVVVKANIVTGEVSE